MIMAEPATVYTIGHSTHTIEEFIALLGQHAVTAIADVRSTPYSRFQPQFNREGLQAALKRHNLAYVYLGGELGARTDDDSCYENGRVQFDRLARTRSFGAGIERVRSGSANYRIALLCAEREPLECHRALLISRVLTATGITVVHIHADGHLEPHPDAIERLRELLGLPREDLFRSPSDIIEDAYRIQSQRIAYVNERLVSGGDGQET